MDREKALEIIIVLMDEAEITTEDLLDRLVEDRERESSNESKRSDMEILSEALNRAKEITGLEDQDIGDIVGVTGGAVGNWRRGRTRASRANRQRIYRWLRSVEDALAVRLMPEDFTVEGADRSARLH